MTDTHELPTELVTQLMALREANPIAFTATVIQLLRDIADQTGAAYYLTVLQPGPAGVVVQMGGHATDTLCIHRVAEYTARGLSAFVAELLPDGPCGQQPGGTS